MVDLVQQISKMKLKEKFNKDNLYFTSDTHFFHNNIIEYCNRPFSNVHEMNESLVTLWNSKVPKDGIVFHTGDFSLTASPNALDTLLNRLNGEIHLIIGNHEKDALGKEYIRKRWKSIHDILEIFVEDEEITYGEQHIIMCHYPMMVWNASHRGSWQLFGHVHGGIE